LRARVPAGDGEDERTPAEEGTESSHAAGSGAFGSYPLAPGQSTIAPYQ